MSDNRIYKDSLEFIHDLFMLENAPYFINEGMDDSPLYKEKLHDHVFHSFDSDGREQTRSTATCGHYHNIKWKMGKDGKPTAECGPAMRDVLKKQGKRYVKTSVPVDEQNAHTHKVSYKLSQKLKGRKANVEAVKTISKVAAHQTPELSPEEKSTIIATER